MNATSASLRTRGSGLRPGADTEVGWSAGVATLFSSFPGFELLLRRAPSPPRNTLEDGRSLGTVRNPHRTVAPARWSTDSTLTTDFRGARVGICIQRFAIHCSGFGMLSSAAHVINEKIVFNVPIRNDVCRVFWKMFTGRFARRGHEGWTNFGTMVSFGARTPRHMDERPAAHSGDDSSALLDGHRKLGSPNRTCV